MRQATKAVTLAAILSALVTIAVLSVAAASFIAVSHVLERGPHWSEFRGSEALPTPLRLSTLAHPASSSILHELDAVSTLAELSTRLSAVSSDDPEVPSSLIAAVAPQPKTRISIGRLAETALLRMSFDSPKLAPLGFVRFCGRYPQDCAAPTQSSQPQFVALTDLRKAELEIVNSGVNHSIKASDKVTAADEWLVEPDEGKCTDYAITKRHELLALGWPIYSLLLAEVVIPSGEHHLVLVVRTRENDLVLDNLTEDIRPISKIHYRWVRAQQPGNPKFWASINVLNSIAMNAL